MKNFIEIKDFKVLAGTDIRKAIKEAIDLADYHQCIIRFYFNDVEMEIYKFSVINDMVDYYYRRLKE
jgi:hypothetical protein